MRFRLLLPCAALMVAGLLGGCRERAAAPAPAVASAPLPPAPPEIRSAPPAEARFDLTIKDASVAEALRLLGQASGAKLEVAAGVTGRVPFLDLHEVTLEEALALLAKHPGLVWRREGDTYVIRPAEPPPPSAPRRVSRPSAREKPAPPPPSPPASVTPPPPVPATPAGPTTAAPPSPPPSTGPGVEPQNARDPLYGRPRPCGGCKNPW